MRILPALLIALSFAGCKPAEKKVEAHPSPAKVDKIQQEGELNKIQLTVEAEKRLGITLAPVQKKQVSRVRSYGGEVAVPPGASLVISAPVGGKLAVASGQRIPAVGILVSAKQPLFVLTPLLSPERDVLTPAERISMAQAKNMILTSRIEAAGQVAQAKEQVAAAKIALDRAERLLRDAAGTAKTVDDAKSQLSLAGAALDASLARQKAVESIDLEGTEAGQQTPLVIDSPQSGMIRTLNVTEGEVVAAGTALFEVMKFDPVWVRAPVYAGETERLALDQPAEIKPLDSDGPARSAVAKPVLAPPTATSLAATVDLYYELPNQNARWRPGERVTVQVKLQESNEQLVIPWSAVMHDITGGTWVYENTAEHTYVRRRVQVRYVIGEEAILATGPAANARIVTAGAVELFGTEFGFAK
jgi:cobalt-zinc-cadmium efflux system membrane fusion protein